MIKALLGKADKNIYENGILFNDKLQGYLNKKVQSFVKINTPDKKDQTPTTFGNFTDRYAIVNVSQIFEAEEISQSYSNLSFDKISMLSIIDGNVKNLSGFIRTSHKIPNVKDSTTENFIQNCGTKEIEKEIYDIIKHINKLKYKRKEIETFIETGQASISTPDFDYSVVIKQSEKVPGEYFLTKTLEGFNNSKIINNDDFNSIFSNHFDELKFGLTKTINIENLIDSIEEFDDENIEIKYDHINLTSCIIKILDLEYEIVVESDSISITYYRMTSPKLLAEAFEKTHKTLLQKTQLKLIR